MNSSKTSEGRHSSKEKKSSSSEQTKQPIRTFGEWSEFMSSTGKIYYYNSKTEKTQWDKPDEWDYLVMEDRNSKLERSYYPSKDYKRSYRGGGKYENDAYDYGSPSMNCNKPHRYNSEYKPYSREYSNDYVMPQGGYRQNSYPHYSDHHRPPSYHMPDYYETGPPSNSPSANDYYNNASSMGSGGYSRGYGSSKDQDKYWNEQRGSKSRGGSSGVYSKSTRDDKEDARYSYSNNNGPYEDSASHSSGKSSYMYHKHASRFDNYNESSSNSASKYQASSSMDALNSTRASSSSTYQNDPDYNNRYKGSSSRGTVDQRGSDYYDYYDQPAATGAPSNTGQSTRAYSRASSSSSNSSNTNTSYSKNNHKKMKKYDENRPDYARNRSISPNQYASSKSASNLNEKPNDRDASLNNNDTDMTSAAAAVAAAAASSSTSAMDTSNSSKTVEAAATTSSSDERAALQDKRASSTEPSTSTKPAAAANSATVTTTGHHEEMKEGLPPRHTISMPLLGTSVEDINKYYKPELVTRFIADLGTSENISWINQPFTRLLSSSKSAVEVQNYRTMARINEIKKNLLEQRLLFLQTQMKEIEEYLN